MKPVAAARAIAMPTAPVPLAQLLNTGWTFGIRHGFVGREMTLAREGAGLEMNVRNRCWRSGALVTTIGFAVLVGCASHPRCPTNDAAQSPAASLASPAPATSSGGYLPPDQIPNSRLLLPPLPDSTGIGFDVNLSEQSASLQTTKAWQLAISDADLSPLHPAKAFWCTLKATITAEHTPRLYRMLQRVQDDAGSSTAAAKDSYKRKRPYQVNGRPVCASVGGYSYPSGHNAIGTAWALVLVEVAPEYRDEILARGQSFGLSRIICNAHWYSDTLQGRYMGAYTVARLHADPCFRSDVEAAAKELVEARKGGHVPSPQDCSEEEAGVAAQKALWDQI